MKAQKLGLGARAFGELGGVIGTWRIAVLIISQTLTFLTPFLIPTRVPSQFIAYRDYFPTSRLGVLNTPCLIALLWPQTACNKIIANDPSSRSGKAKSNLPPGRLSSSPGTPGPSTGLILFIKEKLTRTANRVYGDEDLILGMEITLKQQFRQRILYALLYGSF